MRFSHEAQSTYSILLLPRSLEFISIPGSIPCLVQQPVIMALANWNTIICHILPGPHSYTSVESSNVDKLPCWRTKVHGDGKIRTRALNVRVEWDTPIYHNTSTTWYNVGVVMKPCISSILDVQESQQNGCLNTVMNGTAFFLPCHSGSIFSDWNLQIGQDKI